METLLQKTGFSEKQCENILENPYNSFRSFFFEVFALAVKRVEGVFLPADHLIRWATILQIYPRTSIVSARKHLKTTLDLGYLAWKLFRMEKQYNEWLFLAYKTDLGEYQLKRLNRYIEALPEDEFFGTLKRLTPADTIIRYGKDGKEFICEAEGMESFKRGRAPDGIIADDILKDPEAHLDLSQIEKITQTFFEQVESMPKDELHVSGTPQDDTDLFSRLEQSKSYYAIRCSAEKDIKNCVPLWGNRFPWEKLQEIRLNIGDKAYKKEYLCQPVRGTEGYISIDKLNRLINPKAINYGLAHNLNLSGKTMFAGMDLGKKTHPSHLTVFIEEDGRLKQIHSKFMDGWDYQDQIEYTRQAIKAFQIDCLLYDNTRAEFECAYEQGDLPGEMTGVTFTSKSKFSMATEVDRVVTNEIIELLPDERQKRQILSVDCDLKAPETAEGHGDAFFSLCLAVQAWANNRGDVSMLV
jgi:hypothetical protein